MRIGDFPSIRMYVVMCPNKSCRRCKMNLSVFKWLGCSDFPIKSTQRMRFSFTDVSLMLVKCGLMLERMFTSTREVISLGSAYNVTNP